MEGAGRKRKKETDGGDSKPRKRFVWPDHLHREFIAAVFDVGLRCASPATVMEALAEHGVNLDQVQAELHKFRTFRQLQRGTSAGRSDEPIEVKAGDAGLENGALTSLDQAAPGEGIAESDQITQLRQLKADRKERIGSAKRAIQAQAELIEQSLSVLSRFQREVSQAMDHQSRMKGSVVQRLRHLGVQLDSGPLASSTSAGDAATSLPRGSAPLPGPGAGGGGSGGGAASDWALEGLGPAAAPTARRLPLRHSGMKATATGVSSPGRGAVGVRQRAQMEQEMIAHMDMHRTMEMHMRDQLAQYGTEGVSDGGSVRRPVGSVLGDHLPALPEQEPAPVHPEQMQHRQLQPTTYEDGSDLALLDGIDEQLFEFLND